MDFLPLWISIKTSILSTAITFVIGVFVAYIMFLYKGKFKELLDSIFMIPLILPPTVVGFLLLLLFGKNNFIGYFLYKYFNIIIIFSWPATVIASIVVSFPLMYKTSKITFEQIDKNLIYSAKLLGAKECLIFSKIILPLSWPGICSGIVLSFARSLGEFGATLMIAGNIVGKTQTVPIAIYFAVENDKTKDAFIWIIIIIIISILGISFINYLEKKNKNINIFIRNKENL